MSSKSKIRDIALGKAAKFRTDTFTIPDPDGGEGVTVELRQPSVAGRAKIFAKANGKDGKAEGTDALLQIVIGMAYVPGTDEKVFDDADLGALRNLPTGAWLDEIGVKATELLNGKDAGKSSAESPSDS